MNHRHTTFNYRVVAQLMGALIWIESAFLILALAVAIGYHGPDVRAFLIAALITFVCGGTALFIGRNAEKRVGRRESYLIVALVWVVLSFFGCLPYILSGSIPNWADAYFETMSGFSTTGSTILTHIEGLPHGILFWRSLTQWLGGMGVIVLSLAILPMFGIGSMHLYQAEAPGPTYEKLAPRIADTAKIMWGMYCTLTTTEVILLRVFGMTWFDAVCHSLCTMASGGFSTHDASIGYFHSPAIEYVVITFMLLTSINYSLLFWGLKGKFKRITRDDESRLYLTVTILLSTMVAVVLIGNEYLTAHTWHIEQHIRTALFQVISLFSTTGFATDDYMQWPGVLMSVIFFALMFGGAAGSTAGGIKWVRVAVMLKNIRAEFKRMLHPSAIIPVRLNGRILSNSVVHNVFAFIVVYYLLFAGGTLLFVMHGIPHLEAMAASASALSNVGPGIGASGPAGNFAHFCDFDKWVLSFYMMVGRLELFTVLLLFVPSFWKR